MCRPVNRCGKFRDRGQRPAGLACAAGRHVAYPDGDDVPFAELSARVWSLPSHDAVQERVRAVWVRPTQQQPNFMPSQPGVERLHAAEVWHLDPLGAIDHTTSPGIRVAMLGAAPRARIRSGCPGSAIRPRPQRSVTTSHERIGLRDGATNLDAGNLTRVDGYVLSYQGSAGRRCDVIGTRLDRECRESAGIGVRAPFASALVRHDDGRIGLGRIGGGHAAA